MNSKIPRVFIVVLVVVVGGFGIKYLMDFSLFDCGNTVLEEKKNGENKAVVFQRDCGATTGYSYHVSVLKEEKKIKDTTGNVFISKNDKIEFKWIGEKKLLIYIDPKYEVYLQNESVMGIEIQYQIKVSEQVALLNSEKPGASLHE